MPVVPALRRLRQEDHEFEASLGSLARSCLKTKTKRQNYRDSKNTSGNQEFEDWG
jgi:hypothetical protein